MLYWSNGKGWNRNMQWKCNAAKMPILPVCISRGVHILVLDDLSWEVSMAPYLSDNLHPHQRPPIYMVTSRKVEPASIAWTALNEIHENPFPISPKEGKFPKRSLSQWAFLQWRTPSHWTSRVDLCHFKPILWRLTYLNQILRDGNIFVNEYTSWD